MCNQEADRRAFFSWSMVDVMDETIFSMYIFLGSLKFSKLFVPYLQITVTDLLRNYDFEIKNRINLFAAVVSKHVTQHVISTKYKPMPCAGAVQNFVGIKGWVINAMYKYKIQSIRNNSEFVAYDFKNSECFFVVLAFSVCLNTNSISTR